MSGELAYLLQLISAYATGSTVDESSFPNQFIASTVAELHTDPRVPPAELATGLPAWFAGLRRRGVERLLLAIPGVNGGGEPPDRSTLGFSNAAGWFLVGTGPHGERWRAAWSVGDQNAPGQRIWHVRFQGVIEPTHVERDGAPLLDEPQPLDDARGRLIAALHAVHDFAVEVNLQPWPASFERALAIATSDTDPPPLAAYQHDLLASGWLTPQARVLARAAYASFVFGGMGTWNDVGSANEAEAFVYRRLSDDLCTAMLGALVAAANS